MNIIDWGLEWERPFPLGGKRQPSHTEWCLLNMARAQTHQHCDTPHDQYAAERSRNKLLTTVSLWPELGPATAVARAGWVPECHPKSCGTLGNLNYRGTRDRTKTPKGVVGELSVTHKQSWKDYFALSKKKDSHSLQPISCHASLNDSQLSLLISTS